MDSMLYAYAVLHRLGIMKICKCFTVLQRYFAKIHGAILEDVFFTERDIPLYT